MRLPDRLGFRGKTLWDWLQLLIVPAILIGVTFAWSATQTRRDNKREDRRSQDATLQAYLDQMSRLMLHENLLGSKEDDAVRAVAPTVTLTALRRVDGERKAEVLRVLYEARLLGTRVEDARINLKDADLEGADLADANLMGARLDGAMNHDLDRFTTKQLRRDQRQGFFDSQMEFLLSLSGEELLKFNLSPEKLAKFRREAKAA